VTSPDTMLDKLPMHQHIFHSPRLSQDPHQQMTPVQLPPHLSSQKGSPYKQFASQKQSVKLAQIRGKAEVAGQVKSLQGSVSPPPTLTSGKVKKIKVTKLSKEQLN